MTGLPFVLRAVRCFHAGPVDGGNVRRLSGSVGDAQVAYRLFLPGGESLAIRAVRAERPVPDGCHGAAATTRGWVGGRIATLVRLEHLGYPAPRPVRSPTGELIVDADGWLVTATSYVDGPVIRPTPGQLRLLGAALGRLHALPDAPDDDADPPDAPVGDGSPPGRSGWHLGATIPHLQRTLAATRPVLPEPWTELHAAFRRAVEAIREYADELPEVITHADAWPGNGVQTAPDQVTLIDWDTGGRGPALLDLGRCLLECHLDTDLPAGDPAAWLVRPDEPRIAAVAQGYRQRRSITALETDLLLAGVRFGIAVVGAVHFADVLLDGRSGAGMDARLARLRNRVEISEEVAAIAARHLTT